MSQPLFPVPSPATATDARGGERPFKALCVVPLYHPSPETWQRWIEGSTRTERLLLFDNTPASKELRPPVGNLPPNLTYMAAGANRGVATVFNQAARIAESEGCSHLLTLDQDSEPPAGLVTSLYSALPAGEWARTGLVGPQHGREDMALTARASTTLVESLMSSGCLVNLAAWRAVGGYNERFFMDHVDTDFCLRLRRAGYRIVRCDSVIMPHHLGASRVHVLLGRRFLVNHHPPARRYTIARNTVGLCRLHGRDFPGLRRRQARDLLGIAIKMLLFERHKGAQLIAILCGLRDGLRERQTDVAPSAQPRRTDS